LKSIKSKQRLNSITGIIKLGLPVKDLLSLNHPQLTLRTIKLASFQHSRGLNLGQARQWFPIVVVEFPIVLDSQSSESTCSVKKTRAWKWEQGASFGRVSREEIGENK
jgi:hypothetical protein